MGQHRCTLSRGASMYSAKILCYLFVSMAACLGSADGDGPCLQSVSDSLLNAGGPGLGVLGSESSTEEDALEENAVSQKQSETENCTLQTELEMNAKQQQSTFVPLSFEHSKARPTNEIRDSSTKETVADAPTLRDILAQVKLWMAVNMRADIMDTVVTAGTTLLVVLLGSLAIRFCWYPYLRHRLGPERVARRTALHTAVMEPEEEGVRSIDHLIREGGKVDVNERDQAGRTPLHYAKTKTVAQCLLKAGAKVDAIDNQSLTPLHRACSRARGGTDLVIALLQHGASVNAKSNWDYTPLHMACFHGNVEVVKILLAWKAGVLHKNHVGYSALHEAAFNGSLPVAELLLEHGAEKSLDQVAQGTMHLPGGTPSDVAWARGNMKMAEKLAQHARQ